MIVIIDYGMGNTGSIKNMFKKIGHPSVISADPEEIIRADKIILPGVGAFDRAMANLQELGLITLLKEKVAEGIPFLGICLGMQLLADYSEEGDVEGLGVISGKVVKFRMQGLKVPHMGWNLVCYEKGQAMFQNFEEFEESKFYFVHSYHFVCDFPENISGVTSYGEEFTSAIHLDHVYGVQFHPEKSHKYGMQLLENFVKI